MLVESKKNKKAIRKNPLGRPKVTCTSPSNGGAKIQINTNSAISNLQQLLPKYNSQSTLKGLKTDIRRALGLPEKEGASDYGVFVIEDNGTSKECSIRISNHNANAGNYEGKKSDTNISIKMRSRVNKNAFKPHKDIELMEYTYFDYLLMNVEQPIQKIILSIIEYLSNGIYNDKTGVALQNTSPQQANNDTENNQEIKENKIMNKKQVVRINENQLRQIVTESVKRVLKEGKLVNNKPFFKNDNMGGKDILPGDEIWNQNYDYYSDPKTKDAAIKHDYRATMRQSKDELGNKPNNTVYEKNLIIKAFIQFMHGRPEFMNDELRYDPHGRAELLSNFSSMLHNKYGINIASYDLKWLEYMDWHNKKLYTTRIKREYPEEYGDVSSSDSLSKLQKAMDDGEINEAITHAIRKVLG